MGIRILQRTCLLAASVAAFASAYAWAATPISCAKAMEDLHEAFPLVKKKVPAAPLAGPVNLEAEVAAGRLTEAQRAEIFKLRTGSAAATTGKIDAAMAKKLSQHSVSIPVPGRAFGQWIHLDTEQGLVEHFMKAIPANAPAEMRKAAEEGIRAMHDPARFKAYLEDMLNRAAYRQVKGAAVNPLFEKEPKGLAHLLEAVGEDAAARGFGDGQGNLYKVLDKPLNGPDFASSLSENKLLVDHNFGPGNISAHGVYPHVIGVDYFAAAVDQATGVPGTGSKFLQYISKDPGTMKYWSEVMDSGQGMGIYSPSWISKNVVRPLAP